MDQTVTSNGTVGRRPKVRDVLADLKARGWYEIRRRGSHAIFRKDRRTFPFPILRPNDEVTQAVLLTYRRIVLTHP